ncbi:MAG TPA: hypothetical protein VGI55_03185 [Solirubrobacteraceae bacterium]
MLAIATVLGFGVIAPPIASARLAWKGPLAHDSAGPGPTHYAGVACALVSQCTAVDETGDEVTFDPRSGAVLSVATVDPGAQAVYALACPSDTECTAVDLAGNAVTFDPRLPASRSSRRLTRTGDALLGIACPTTDQCTAVDQDRYEITFDPGESGGPRHVLLGTELGTGITGLACGSVTRCVVVDGAGEAVGFNPRRPGRPRPVQVLNDSAVGVVCPSATECVLASSGGERVTLALGPASAAPSLKQGTISNARVDTAQPTALACPDSTYCLLVDSTGHAVEFDPGGSGATTTGVIAAGQSLSGVACVSPALCVAVDSAGDAFSGAGKLPRTPVATRRPSVSGVALQGHVLRGSARVWSGVRTSLRLQWLRCSRRGRSCYSIPGAIDLSYRLTAADAGHRLRLFEQAANQAGRGPAVVSALTGQVRGLPAGPTVSHLSLSGLGGGHPRLAFELRASIWGPRLRSVRVQLPAGLSARRSGSGFGALPFEAFGTGSEIGGLWAGSFAVLRGGRGVELTSDPAAEVLRVDLRSGLVAAHELIERARRHVRTKLTLTVSIAESAGQTLRTAALIALGIRSSAAGPVKVR